MLRIPNFDILSTCCWLLVDSHRHTHTYAKRQLFSMVLSLPGLFEGGMFLWMLSNIHSNKWLGPYCFVALLRCTRGSRARPCVTVLEFSVRPWVMKCYTCSRLCWDHSWPRLSMHTIHKRTILKSPLIGESAENQCVKHLPCKHYWHVTHSSLTSASASPVNLAFLIHDDNTQRH